MKNFMVMVILSASIERFSVFCMQDFFADVLIIFKMALWDPL